MPSIPSRTWATSKIVSLAPLIASHGRLRRFANRVTPPGEPMTGTAAAIAVASASIVRYVPRPPSLSPQT